ncbi:hypothetical protein GEV43_31665 [Actinomadura sp. J1-007]|uniref:alpha/beta hydrolase family protein n=1 Tax=Actinomadura sp. J1-007 TaxID=2661913 RepID=UPI001321268B|nr:hypothetical protein [Actinomadura sp. J1-007]MWK38159.1 hypothetical protein [Actinomadura sp. J1-007]
MAAGRPERREGRVRLALPEPTGPRRVGTTSLHLIDRSRRDPWTSPAPRELMVSLWYPARGAAGHPRAPWFPPAASELYEQQTSQGLRTPLDGVDFPVTHGHEGAPVAVRPGGHPVVLYSPGYGAERELNTALVEDLASRGYVVVTIDHTHESGIVEFPGGRVERGRTPPKPSPRDYARALRVRVDDARFVLDELAALDSGRNPDAEHRGLPRGVRGSLDLSKVGMFGHSFGGATAAQAMARDRRIRAGIDLDGSVDGPVQYTGLGRPFMLMANATHGRGNDPSWARFWRHLRGWRLQLRLRDSGHQTYTDVAPLVRQLENALPLPPDVVAEMTERIGTIDPGTAVAAQRAYIGSFFDLHLRRHDDRLLSGPSPRHPEIEFVP